MNFLKYILIIFPVIALAQVNTEEQDSTIVKYLIIKGDSVPRTRIDLDEVMLLHKLKFDSKADRIRYLILRRKTIKVYPYAKMAADRLDSLSRHLATLTKKRHKKKIHKANSKIY